MKTIQITLVFLTAWTFLQADNRMEKEFDVSPGRLLEVDLNTGGSIDIIGWDQNKVRVEARTGYGDIEDYDIDIDVNSRGVYIDVTSTGWSNSRGDVSFDINVPVQFNLEIETMGGEIRVDNVSGDIRGETMGGELNLSNLKGEIKMTTMGGDITVRNSELNGTVKTMGGEILMEDVIGDVDGSTMGGDVIYRNVRKTKGGDAGNDRPVSISTMGGEIEVDRAPNGADVSTMGGDILVRSAQKFVKAKTMGGDVTIDAINGGADASTMGGDVTVTMTGDPEEGDRDVDLSSMGGDIRLTVPAGLSMEFDIQLTYTDRKSGRYSIESDFPINIEESEAWDYSEGSPRKHIYGTGKVGDGKHLIRIETINGNIIIKKGS